MKRFILMLCAMVGMTLLPPGVAGAHAGACSGIAPLESVCSTGLHVVTGTVQLAAHADFGYTGRILSEVRWTAGGQLRTFAVGCDAIAGVIGSCGTLGAGWPPAGVTVEHRCLSHSYGVHAEIVGQPTPSFGGWSCRIDFH